MSECQSLGVQEITAVAWQARLWFDHTAGVVERIAGQWMSRIGEVDADLMRPPGRDLDFEQRAVWVPFRSNTVATLCDGFPLADAA